MSGLGKHTETIDQWLSGCEKGSVQRDCLMSMGSPLRLIIDVLELDRRGGCTVL